MNGQPPKLTRMTIHGFRSIRSAKIELGDLTVMIGANGAGKSNVLGFTKMLSYMMEESLSSLVRTWRGSDHLLFGGPKRTQEIAGELLMRGEGTECAYAFSLAHSFGGTLDFTREAVSLRHMQPAASPVDYEATDVTPESHIPALAQDASDLNLRRLCAEIRELVSSIGLYHLHDTSDLAPLRGAQGMRNDRALHTDGGNLAVMLRRMRQEDSAFYRRIVEELRRVLPEFKELVLEEDSQRAGTMELRWTGPNPEYILGPDQLSDGSLRALALITLLLLPDRFLPWVVAIDEPELGLHPAAVGQIARLVAETSTRRQIIVSTQSPTFIAQFDPEDIVVVEKPEDETLFRRLSRADLQDWLDAYEGDLGRLFEMNVLGGSPR